MVLCCADPSLAPADAGKGGAVHKVGDGLDLERVATAGGVLLDERELVDALHIERLSVLELATQKHLFFFFTKGGGRQVVNERVKTHGWDFRKEVGHT